MADKKIKTKVTKGPKAAKVVKEQFQTGSETLPDIKAKWWDLPDAQIAASVSAVVKAIDQNQHFRNIQNLKFARLYSNKELLGLASGLWDRTPSKDGVSNRVTYNVIRSVTDTAASKIAKMRPRTLVLTDDGDFSLQTKAKKLSKYLEGVFYDCGIYEEAQRVFTDACVFGTGALKFFEENGRIKVERVFIGEIIVDEAEGIHEKPRQLHQKKLIDRSLLLEMFPEHANAINQAKSASDKETGIKTSADQVEVIESWHLPSSVDAKDGKHSIVIDNATLFAEDYVKDYFPFAFFRWSPRLLGFFGSGVAEELIGIQIEINKLLRNIQQSQNLAAVPRVFVENGSSVVTEHINNEIGSIIKYVGTPPVISPSPAMSPEVYQHVETLYLRAFEITGVSVMSATSRKPEGLDSGIAIREAQDIETERFAITSQRYQELFIDAANMIIDMSRDLYEDFPELEIKVKGEKFIETIAWKDVDMSDDSFLMKVYPTSLLPTTPAGKLQKVSELIQAGFIDRKQGLALLDFPDLEEVVSRETAAFDTVKMIMESIIDKGKYISPEPFMDLDLTLQVAQTSYLKAKVRNVPEDRLELLRRFMEDIVTLQEQEVLARIEQQEALIAEQQAAQVGQAAAADVVDAAAVEESQIPEQIVGEDVIEETLPTEEL